MVIKVYRFFYRLEDNGKTKALLFRDGSIVSLYHVQAIEQKQDPSVSSTALLGCNGYGVYNFFELSRTVDDHIEVKVFTGNSSLRRKLLLCTLYVSMV